MKTFLLYILLGLCSGVAYSANIIVDSTTNSGTGSLRQAVLDAGIGDTILFSSAIDGDTIMLTSGEIQLNKNLVILGNDSLKTIIDGNSNDYIFQITSGDTVIIDGVKLQNGSAFAGCIYNEGVLTILNSNLYKNSASNNGGAIFNVGKATLMNSSILYNTANSWGGGVYNTGADASVQFNNCLIKGNSSSSGGANLNRQGSTASFTDCIIANNNSSAGGAIYNQSDNTVTFTDCDILNNTSTSSGGGIYSKDSSSITLINCNILENTGTSGGGIYNDEGGFITISSCTLSHNSATGFFGNGGAIENRESTISILNTSISENHADNSGSGGGISNGFGGKVAIEQSSILSNSSSSGGGLINGSSFGDSLFVKNSIISGNSSSGSGGCMYNLGWASFTNSQISGNTASSGGGGFMNDNGTIELINSTLSGNKSPSSGGGINNFFGSILNSTNTIIAKNTDNGSGPDVYSPFATINDGGFNLIGDTTGTGDAFIVSTLVGGTGDLLDPLFIEDVPNDDSLGGNLRLTASSPAINTGNNSQNICPTDLDENPRLIDCKIDIGCYEIQGISNSIAFVINAADTGCGSLRQIISDAVAGDTIKFSPQINGDTIKLTSGQILIDKKLCLLGNDTSNTIISGTSNSRIFEIAEEDTFKIHGTRLIGGEAVNGGAIYNDGILYLSNSLLHKNNATDRGGAIYNYFDATAIISNTNISENTADQRGGAIYNVFTTLTTFDSCIVSGNTCSFGGGIYNDGICLVVINNSRIDGNSASAGQGGGIYNAGNTAGLSLTNTTLSRNSAYNGGGIYNTSNSKVTFDHCILSSNFNVYVMNQNNHGGAINNSGGGFVQLFNSTICSNSAPDDDGGGIYNASSSMVFISNSTLAGNTSEHGAGFTNLGFARIKNSVFSGNKTLAGNGTGGALYNISNGSVELINSTIAGNEAMHGGGIYHAGDTIYILNSIIATNSSSFGGEDIRTSVVIIDGGYNLIGDTTTAGAQFVLTTLKGGTGNLLDPLFVSNVPSNDSLGGNLQLQSGSPAINGGSPDTSGLGLGPVDRAGLARITNCIIDIGAYEGVDTLSMIQVTYNGTCVPNGSTSPSNNNGTNFQEVCASKMEIFLIKNVRTDTLVLDSINILNSAGNSGIFSYNDGDFAFPRKISPGDSAVFKISYLPNMTGIDSAFVSISNSDSTNNPYSFLIIAAMDTTAPNSICKDTSVTLDPTGNAVIDSSLIDGGSWDNCGILSMDLDTSIFNCEDVGIKTVMLTVTDINGNSSACISNVTVEVGSNLIVDNTLLAIYGESGVYLADSLIQSNATIKTLNEVVFKSGEEVLLLPGFSVEPGASFETLKEKCGN